MAQALTMPKYGMTMEEGTVTLWRKNEGEVVDKGDIVVEVQADKSTMEVEAECSGTLLRIVVPEGATVPCGTVLAWFGSPGESVPEGEA